MSAPIYYKAVSRLTGTLEYSTHDHDWMLGWAATNKGHLALWDVIEVFPDDGEIRHRAEDWLRDRMPAFEPPEAPKAIFYSPLPQSELQTALRRYNARYSNDLYLAATYSLLHMYDEEAYIVQCIRIQDVALYLCGARNQPFNPPARITPSIVKFWNNFLDADEDEDDPSQLPF